jgi:hypothetical protein
MRSPLLTKKASDPSYHVHGYGVLSKSQIEKKAKQYMEQFAQLAEEGKWSNLSALLGNGVFGAMVKTLSEIELGKLQPEPEVADPSFPKESKLATADEFMGALLDTCRAARKAKTARPEVLDTSLLYLKLIPDPQDPQALLMSFFSPKLRQQEGAQNLTYKVEIGEKGTSQIRRDLNRLVIPQMRSDVMEDDHGLLEKVIYRLRNIVLDSAMEYQSLSDAEKAQWKNMVRMDITKYQDVSVRIQEQGKPEEKIAGKKTRKQQGVSRLVHQPGLSIVR